MSKSIGINTDPLDVEIYVENGLIKGRIVTLNNEIIQITATAQSTNVIEKQDTILNKIFTNVYSFQTPVFNTFATTNYNIETNIQFSDRFEYFDYMKYSFKYDIYNNKAYIYNHYSTNNSNETYPIDDCKPNTSDIINVLMTAKEKLMAKILIIFSQTPQYQTIEKYFNEDVFEDYYMVASGISCDGSILKYDSVMITSQCYDDLIDLICNNKAPWYIHMANYMNSNIFNTKILDNNLFK